MMQPTNNRWIERLVFCLLLFVLFAAAASAEMLGDIPPAPTPIPTPAPTPTPSDPPPEWQILYEDYFAKDSTANMRCFMTLADLNFDGTPELLYGRFNKLDSEIEVDVLTISGNRAIRAMEGTINGAHNLSSAVLSLYHTKKGYSWTLVTTGNAGLNGRWQTRHTTVMFDDGTVTYHNRFTKRTSLESSLFYIEGEEVSKGTYEKQFAKARAELRMAGRVPSVSLGKASDPDPTKEQVIEALDNLTKRYLEFAKPSKIKLMVQRKQLKLNGKMNTKLKIATSYGSATKSAVTYSVSDPTILSVTKKGGVKAVGYGTAYVIATLPSGNSARTKVSVPRPKVKKISVSSQTKTIKRGEQMQMFYKLSPIGARAKIRWYSSDSSVVHVDESSGMATGLKRGSSLVSCFVGAKLRGSVYINVENGTTVQEIGLSQSDIALHPGERYAIGVHLQPENATNRRLTFRSTDERVATINASGRIVARNYGTATISVEAFGGSSEKLTVHVIPNTYQMDAHINDGVYELVLQRQGSPLLMLDSYAPQERAPIVPRMRQGTPIKARFLIQNTENNEIEIRPLVSPHMYLSIYAGEHALELGLKSDAKPEERRFRMTRMDDGTYSFYLADRPTKSFGIPGQKLGVPAQVLDYTEVEPGTHFRLIPVGALPGEKPQDSGWAKRMFAFLSAHEDELNNMSHIQLCDLDWNGTPELILYTGTREKSATISLTALNALVYSDGDGDGMTPSFEYEPSSGTDFNDNPSLPKLRLLVSQQTGQRSWILTDGAQNGSTGSMRYVDFSYDQGVIRERTLFEKTWAPGPSGTDGIVDDRYYENKEEMTQHAYSEAFQKHFESHVWREGASAIIETTGKTTDNIISEIMILLAGRNWFA